MNGYLNPQYAESLADFGRPRLLPKCGGWLLERTIPGFADHDAMGCYPLFICKDWRKLASDLDSLGADLVSVSMVPDPFGECDIECLKEAFRDVVIPFKEHFVVDLSRPRRTVVGKHHQYYARAALRKISVEVTTAPSEFLDDWVGLYDILINRHKLDGIKAFSKKAFAKQLEIPGIVMLRAVHEGRTVGAHLWYIHGEVAVSHLAAFSAVGYDVSASYALYWEAIGYFADHVRWLNIGGGAGTQANADDGLASFKRGWATGSRTAYFCGRVLSHQRYEEIVRSTGESSTGYFPAYRAGELYKDPEE